MSFPTTSKGSSISHHLRATKKILLDAISDARIATTLDKEEVNALERETFEILRLIGSWRNTLAPINKIPPEVLAIVLDFWDPEYRDRGLIALTHVCRAWREVFVSWPSLWNNINCVDGRKIRVYLERSKSSPINLSLHRSQGDFPFRLFFRIIPHVGRLKSLRVRGTPENVEAVAACLSHPTPLLEHLSIYAGYSNGPHNPFTLPPALFNGDISSLRTLRLEFVRTELPWRNMVNLTSFTLGYTPPGEATLGQLLDFLESAPRLHEVDLRCAAPTTGAQNRRLVSLPCLKSMNISGGGRSSILLDHLLIPAGAELTTQVPLINSLIGEHLPRSLGNLKNFSDFTIIQLYFNEPYPRMKFSGPNGEVSMIPTSFRVDWTGSALGSLTQLDTSKTERLEIYGASPLSNNPLYQALIPMNCLRILTLSECERPHVFIRASDPGTSSSEVMVCPELEELVVILCADDKTFDIASVTEMAAARASRGAKLKLVRIVDGQGENDLDLLELKEHVCNVEYGPEVGNCFRNSWHPRTPPSTPCL